MGDLAGALASRTLAVERHRDVLEASPARLPITGGAGGLSGALGEDSFKLGYDRSAQTTDSLKIRNTVERVIRKMTINTRNAAALMGLESGCFDSHCHVFRADLPMVVPRRYTPEYHALPEELFDLLSVHGLNGALLIQPSFLGSDNSYLLETLARNTTNKTLMLKGVVVLNPSAIPDKSSFIRMEKLGVIGVRLNLIQQSDSFDYNIWKSLLAAVEDRGWHIELHCEVEALPKILPLLVQNHAKVVIDHYGHVTDINNCDGLKTILDQPPDRLWIKTSAPYRLECPGDKQAVQSHVKKLGQLFRNHIGAERVMWGSDWPFTQFEDSVRYKDMLVWAS